MKTIITLDRANQPYGYPQLDGSGKLPLPYKVYTALLTQSGGDDPLSLLSQDDPSLTIGVTYQIGDDGGSGWDFTNVGAPNNDLFTYFVATGTTPASWGNNGYLIYNTGAPVATILENTIGNVWFTYNFAGDYLVNSSDLFTNGKTFTYIGCDPNFDPNGNPVAQSQIKLNDSTNILIQSFIIDTNGTGVLTDGLMAYGTPIEIRIYN